MIFLIGRRPYGRVDVCDGTWVETEFAHLNYLPLVPIRSRLVVGGPSGESLAIPLRASSVGAAYLRTWGVLAAVVAVVIGSVGDDWGSAFGGLALGALLAAVVYWSFTRLGEPSAREREQRRVYAELAGMPIDVAALARGAGVGATELREKLHAALGDEARALSATSTYRAAPLDASAWQTVARDPMVTHPTFLKAALTLARLEWASATGREKRELAALHEDLWRRIAASPEAQSSLARARPRV